MLIFKQSSWMIRKKNHLNIDFIEEVSQRKSNKVGKLGNLEAQSKVILLL